MISSDFTAGDLKVVIKDMREINIRSVLESHYDIFQSSVLLGNLKKEDVIRALEILNAHARQYSKDEFVHFPYSPMEQFGFVLSGVVQVCSDDIEGNRMTLHYVDEGKTFGESLCFLQRNETSLYILAYDNSSILWLSSPWAVPDMQNDSLLCELKTRFTAMLAARTLSMNDHIQVLSKIKLRDKLVTYFSQLAEQEGGQTVTIPFTREDMASYFGTDRSALSRELSRMKSEGIIEYRKNVFILLNKK